MSSVTLFDIKRFAVHDGPGIRTTVFLKGCPMDCWWCHNPESRKHELEEVSYLRKLGDKEIESKKIYGKVLKVHEIMGEIMKDKIFFEESGGGVTFSGGEPLSQVDGLLALLKACKIHGLHTAIDTCGYAQWQSFEKLLPFTDLFLYDLKLMDAQKHEHFTGVKNDRIIRNLKKLLSKQARVDIRIPVIPGVNDSEEEIWTFLNFLKTLPGKSSKVHLLPYHDIADNKYLKLNLKNRMKGMEKINGTGVEDIRAQFIDAGFEIGIGG
jgi:pyruvate formate lyase activating enzyme